MTRQTINNIYTILIGFRPEKLFRLCKYRYILNRFFKNSNVIGILFSFFFVISPVIAQSINNIEITATGDFSSKLLSEYSGFSTGAQYFPAIIDTIKSRINNSFNNQGYFDAEFF